ncbi:hypothetical protein [Aestuariivirga sp.]|jgi:hypothetical protein|uniref:hypothetical protein n=1 Tax=Aestuariivirga sp. TaxID=2650926 RepID=UPI003784CD8A
MRPGLSKQEKTAIIRSRSPRTVPSLWAAGGTPNAVFEIGFEKLVKMPGATVADVKT